MYLATTIQPDTESASIYFSAHYAVPFSSMPIPQAFASPSASLSRPDSRSCSSIACSSFNFSSTGSSICALNCSFGSKKRILARRVSAVAYHGLKENKLRLTNDSNEAEASSRYPAISEACGVCLEQGICCSADDWWCDAWDFS